MKIMVIDDSPTMLFTITKYLEQLGHQIITSLNPLEAIELFTTSDPDLIILDVVMGECSGYDVARNIRKSNTSDWVPIIFLSADISDDAIAEGIEAGGDDYLTKPFSEITLKAKINAMVRIAKMRQQLISVNLRLEELSSTDVLTGIANRLFFEKTIRKSIAQAKRRNQKFAILYIDLDNFKTTNDTLGHHFGDLLLKSAVDRMKNILREEDFIARLGGDEFAIIISGIDDTEAATQVANKLVKAFIPPFILDENKVFSSASIGIAMFPDNGTTAENLIKNVDMAMYKSKELGRNTYHCYSESLSEEQLLHTKYEAELRYAINNDELYLEYQPKFDLVSNKIIGVESLLRWKNPSLGLISPEIFIPVAEKTGLIHSIGKWVIENACQQYYIWQQEKYGEFNLAINLSPRQLAKEELIQHIEDALSTYEISPHNIELEITETAIMSGDTKSEELLNKLHDLGITLTIDDFGTGYSSLVHIKRLPINTLKIDKGFVMDIPSDENDIAIVKSILLLSESLNLNVIAEGIETEAQKQFLIDHGCHTGQGFYLAKPLSPDNFIKLLNKT
jgi:diguanylate cyclase (GGDEF)-like protein